MWPQAQLQEFWVISYQAHCGHREMGVYVVGAFQGTGTLEWEEHWIGWDLHSGWTRQGVCPWASHFNSLSSVMQGWKKKMPNWPWPLLSTVRGSRWLALEAPVPFPLSRFSVVWRYNPLISDSGLSHVERFGQWTLPGLTKQRVRKCSYVSACICSLPSLWKRYTLLVLGGRWETSRFITLAEAILEAPDVWVGSANISRDAELNTAGEWEAEVYCCLSLGFF